MLVSYIRLIFFSKASFVFVRNSFSPLSKFIRICYSPTWKSLSLISSYMLCILNIISLFLSPNFSFSAIAALVLSSAILSASFKSETCLRVSFNFSCSYDRRSYNLSISSVFSSNCSNDIMVGAVTFVLELIWSSSSSIFLPISVSLRSGSYERSPSFRRSSESSYAAGNLSAIWASIASFYFYASAWAI